MVQLDAPHTSTPLLETPFQESTPQVSPDGRWLAYTSDETGSAEVYVRPFPSGDGKWQVSTTGGTEPRWRGDSKELFYFEREQLGSLMSVDVNVVGAALSAGSPHKLFNPSALGVVHPGATGIFRYAVSRDGQRILLPVNPRSTTFSATTSSPAVVRLNWAARAKN